MLRYEFGQNWKEFLQALTEEEIQGACRDLAQFLGTDSLSGKRFLDIGCGSGLHSLAAHRLGAKAIVSIDYDALCVDCCRWLKKEKAGDSAAWDLFQWDILSTAPFPVPPSFDVAYAWGVLHHTGHLWQAIDQSLRFVDRQGLFYVALYNKHWTSPYWKVIKRLYCCSPRFLQRLWVFLYATSERTKDLIRPLLLRRPSGHSANRSRGMRWMSDLKDWLGGYPYEYATPQEVTDYITSRGFVLVRIVPNRGTGCSEFLFRREGPGKKGSVS